MGRSSRVRVPNACVSEPAATATANDLECTISRHIRDPGLRRHGSGV
jgi:hypothetical protein